MGKAVRRSTEGPSFLCCPVFPRCCWALTCTQTARVVGEKPRSASSTGAPSRVGANTFRPGPCWPVSQWPPSSHVAPPPRAWEAFWVSLCDFCAVGPGGVETPALLQVRLQQPTVGRRSLSNHNGHPGSWCCRLRMFLFGGLPVVMNA